MSKLNLNEIALNFVNQAKAAHPQPTSRPVINAFSSLFEIRDLSQQEQNLIENLLLETTTESNSAETLSADLENLTRITKEVKAIKRQEMLLIGERISGAREIFKRYKEKGFREWMSLAFGSFKTGYNYLGFYDLYQALPESLKERFKEMPAKAAYILASKKAPIEQKAKIVEEHSNESAQNIISSIYESMEDTSFFEESSLDKELSALEKQIQHLFVKSANFSALQKKKILKMISKMESFVKDLV